MAFCVKFASRNWEKLLWKYTKWDFYRLVLHHDNVVFFFVSSRFKMKMGLLIYSLDSLTTMTNDWKNEAHQTCYLFLPHTNLKLAWTLKTNVRRLIPHIRRGVHRGSFSQGNHNEAWFCMRTWQENRTTKKEKVDVICMYTKVKMSRHVILSKGDEVFG